MSGRSSSSLRRSSKPSYSYSSPKSPVSIPNPVATSTPSVVNHNHQVQQPGFFSNMWQGFGLGAGQSIAMNIFRSDPKVTPVHENVPSTNNSKLLYSIEFSQCLKDKWDNKEACKQYIQCLKDNKDDKSLCNQLT
jgi:hypothetical protein